MEKDPFELSPEEKGWGEVADKYIHDENQRLDKEREEQVKVAQEATKSATLTLSRWIKFVGGFVVCSVVVGLVSPSLPRVSEPAPKWTPTPTAANFKEMAKSLGFATPTPVSVQITTVEFSSPAGGETVKPSLLPLPSRS